MNIGFQNGVSGMLAAQSQMDVLGHNMANVNTAGFKASRMSFNDLIYTEMAINKEEAEKVGHGVRPVSVDMLFAQGNLESTGRELDFAIVGDGFFAVETPAGEREYSRGGAFQISLEGSRGFLVTNDGSYVLDGKGKRILLKKKENSEKFDTENLIERLGIYSFKNPYGLVPQEGGRFMETELSGMAKPYKGKKQEADFELRQYTLERSTVDVAQQMADVIMTQKSYQFNAKIVQTADQMEEIVNNLRN